MDDAVTQVETPGGVEVAIGGTVEPGFEGVRDAFATNFAEHGEVGAGFSLVVDGRTVVDLWGGVADAATGAPYTEDTLQLVFSSTKGATALCANLLAQRGELDVDAPVATYWPEFAQGGKGDIPVRWLLCHQARPALHRRPRRARRPARLGPCGRGAGRHDARCGSPAPPTATTP